MAGRLTKQERQEFLAEPRVAVLSVANGAGRPPHATSIWYAYEPGSEFTFFTGTQGCASRKAELIESAGALTLSVQRSECPYTYVSVEGTVVRTDRPPSSDQRLAIVCRYMTAEQARGFILGELDRPAPGFFLFTVRPDRWLSFDFADDGG